MQKKQKSILVWILPWAGLLLAVLYSPLGSPDMYSNKGFSIANQGVSFQEGQIENAPNIDFGSSNDDNELNVSGYGDSELKTANYAVSGYQSNGSSQGSSYGVQTQTYMHDNSSSNSQTGVGSTFIASKGSGSSAGASSSATMSNGIATLSTNLSPSNNSVRQGASASTTGGTDPGDDPLPDTAIPVPDGWGFLLLLAAIYAFIKRKYFKVKTLEN